ncbi:MAG: hypothetical protein U0Q16_09580 [Bryobacteraceae bacterium]
MSQTRRNLFKAAAAAPLAASAAKNTGRLAADASVYTRLGVKPVINGMGTVTVLGGSIMSPEVIRAMDEAAQFFISLPDLHKKAGARIAELVAVPAAMVTGGAAASFTVATVACMTKGDPKKLQQLPDPTGMPFEIIQQKAHHSGYEHQMLIAGAKVVTVETRQELEAAISPRTAMMFFLNKNEPDGKIKRAEWVEVAKKHGIPTFNDAAADVPGKERLTQYVVKDGFDLVTFSGGKGLRGPQSAGLLLGRPDLIEAGFQAQSPAGGVGRGMKVGKEEIVGMVAAVERYLKVDHEAEARDMDRKVSEMKSVLEKVPGLKLSRHMPVIANEVPHLMMEWNEAGAKLTSPQLLEKLREGEPSIHILGLGAGKAMVSVWNMRGDEHRVVARRVSEIFRA